MKRNTIVEVISYILIFLFVYASVNKLNNYKIFQVQLSKSPFITSYAGILSWALPGIELITALLLSFKALRLQGLYFSLFLMALFTSYLAAMLTFSYYIPCSCGGVMEGLTWKQHILFNLFFILLTIAGIMIMTKDILFKEKNKGHINPLYV